MSNARPESGEKSVGRGIERTRRTENSSSIESKRTCSTRRRIIYRGLAKPKKVLLLGEKKSLKFEQELVHAVDNGREEK